MEIHKPKAAHSIREFLIEIGTIICGILIALGLEQGIEALHRDHALRETREAIRREVADNAARAELSAREDRCMFGALDVFERWAHGGPATPGGGMLNPSYMTTIWDASQSGAVAYMPLNEKFGYAHFFDNARNLQTFVVVQRQQATALSRMLYLGTLTPAEARAMLQTLSEARTIIKIKLMNERGLVQQAKALGIAPVRDESDGAPPAALMRSQLAGECRFGGLSPPDF